MTAVARLSSAIHYLHLEAQLARSEEEFEDYSIALRLLGLLCDGWTAVPNLLNVACGFAVGVAHGKYLRRRAERKEFQRMELARCIPDYDYSLERRIPDRDLSDGRRHFGNQHASKGMDTAAIKAAAAHLGITEQTIYRRLRTGWTWEQALSEPQRQGKGLYGNQFCNLAAPVSEDDDAGATGDTDGDLTPAGLRTGVWATADGQNSTAMRPGAAGEPGLPDPYCRKPPKSVRSPAQSRQLAGVRERVLASVTYFGA